MSMNYEFIPGVDSPGHDIITVTADIPTLTAIANLMPNCQGFNTNGTLKRKISDQTPITAQSSGLQNPGLYVKNYPGLQDVIKPKTLTKYKIQCVNLVRRKDRREVMENLFQRHGLQVEFFPAVDGAATDPSDPQLDVVRNNYYDNRAGMMGCSLSHFQLWHKLCQDRDTDAYLVLEDDVKVCMDFSKKIDILWNQLKTQPDIDILFLGFVIAKETLINHLDRYYTSDTLTIEKLDLEHFYGGSYAYFVTRQAALKMYHQIFTLRNGLRLALDWHLVKSGYATATSSPHLVFTESVQHHSENVDSDIQKSFVRVVPALPIKIYEFEDYDFYPEKDSVGGNILEVAGITIPEMRELANLLASKCVAFNTHGWFKGSVAPASNFRPLKNVRNIPDGLYIKKSYSLTN